LAGDIIIGMQQVNDDWWNGHKGTESGIFPLTHVHPFNLNITTNAEYATKQNTGE